MAITRTLTDIDIVALFIGDFVDNFIGSAVTTPYKEVILEYIKSISFEAKSIGSINTIIKIHNGGKNILLTVIVIGDFSWSPDVPVL